MSTAQAQGWQTPALHLSRRNFVAAMGAAGLLFLPKHAAADEMIDLGLPGGGGERPVTTAFPQKGTMILQRTRPPLLETPFEVFDQGVIDTERSLLRALALGKYSNAGRRRQLSTEYPRPCERDTQLVAR